MTDAWLEELDVDQCVDLLRHARVGRLASVVDGFPVVVPVNYRLVDGSVPWIVVRTRPGGVIEQGFTHVGFEIDGIDAYRQDGWSVLVRGTLRRLTGADATSRDDVDPAPWLEADRDAWLAIEPLTITGRRLHGAHAEWVFHAAAYL